MDEGLNPVPGLNKIMPEIQALRSKFWMLWFIDLDHHAAIHSAADRIRVKGNQFVEISTLAIGHRIAFAETAKMARYADGLRMNAFRYLRNADDFADL